MYEPGDATSRAGVCTHHLRIHGSIAESEVVFDLDIGEHRVGTSSTSEVRLPVPGVSRQHALLIARPDGLVVEDRGSRNGTFIDGVRVDRAVVPTGAEIRFGPVSLRVEAVDSEDRELAVVVDGPPGFTRQPSTATPDRTSRVLPTEDIAGSETWLPLIDAFVERLTAPGRRSLADALDVIVKGLGLAGACVVDWLPDSEPTLVASVASLHEVPSYETVVELWVEDLDVSTSTVVSTNTVVPKVAFFATQPPLSLALMGLAMASPAQVNRPKVRGASAKGFAIKDCAIRGLLCWGETEQQPASTPLLRTLLRLIDSTHPRTRDEAVSMLGAVDSDLVFPAGYRPLRAPPMQHLYGQMRRLLRGDLPTLILGETGVGKERIARILHDSCDRRAAPFVALNCAAIPAELLEAELFGIASGVATGVRRRPGKFQLADGGTLLLDEIGELAAPLQAKLLRALQEKEIHPVGEAPKAVDVRVFAATNADLAEKIESGLFRRDLYYRLSGFVLDVPPLRQCREDIPALVEHFLHRFSEEAQKRIRGLTVGAMRRLASHPWPGNVRELEHVVRGLVYQCPDGRAIESNAVSGIAMLASAPPTIPLDPLSLDARILELETVLVLEALRRTGGNRAEAARLLNISRNGLGKKLKRLGIKPNQG